MAADAYETYVTTDQGVHRLVTDQPLTGAQAQHLVAQQGLAFQGVAPFPGGDTAAAVDVPPAAPVPDASGPATTTATTTTPHPIAEGLGAALGGALVPAAVGTAMGGPIGAVPGFLLGLLGAGGGAVGARSFMEDRPPTPQEAFKSGAAGAAAQAGGAAVGKGVQLAGRALTGIVAPGVAAAGRLAPVIEETAVGPVVRSATGQMASVAKLLDDPAALRTFVPHPGAQTYLARAWWQRATTDGPQGIVNAWKVLGPKAQATLFGPAADDLGQVVATIAQGTTGKGLLSRELTLGIPTYLLGGPKVAAALGAADILRSRALPFLFGKAMTRAGGPALVRRGAATATDFLAPLAQRGAAAGTTAGLGAMLAPDQPTSRSFTPLRRR
jgi:hypothetical protein